MLYAIYIQVLKLLLPLSVKIEGKSMKNNEVFDFLQ